MFKDISSPLVVGCLRGLIVGLLVGIATFGVLFGTGADSHVIVSGVIAAVVPVWLGFLGWGQYDKTRADAARNGDVTAVNSSDVGAASAKSAIRVAGLPPTPVLSGMSGAGSVSAATLDEPVVHSEGVYTEETNTPTSTIGETSTEPLSGNIRPFPEHPINTPNDNLPV